ncbi:MAG: S8 family serine peptidase [Ignavibacteriae bacterium]|nr:S8 family serine peptidase [Ignavibacteriota bacterium]
MIIYRKIRFSVFLILVTAFTPIYLNTTENTVGESLFTKNKFLVQTRQELKISEATGEVSVYTGIQSIDEKNSKYKIKKIKKVFDLNNGDEALYRNLGMDRIYVFYLEPGADIMQITSEYNSDLNIEYSEPNYIGIAAGEKGTGRNPYSLENLTVPNDEAFGKQWYLKNEGKINPSSGGRAKVGADINMTKSWDIELGNEEIIIAILDSGINDDSPDLKGRLWVNKKEIPYNGKDDDRNGYIDDVKGWDFAYDTKNNKDGFGHGTNIASTIGSTMNNTYGFAGVNTKSRLMNCKNLSDENSGEYEWWSKSIKYAVDNGAKIINMSEGGVDYSKTLKAAVEYATGKEVFIAAAMMNKANNKDYYPAAYKGVFAVGATDTDDKRCKKFTWGGGSCWGKHIKVTAPGNKVYGVDYSDFENLDSYWSGTSQSTAIVSALASLLLSQNPGRTPEELENIMCATARDGVGDPREDTDGWDEYMGYGRIDCYLALTYSGVPEKIIEKEKESEKEEEYIKEEETEKDNQKAKSKPQNKGEEKKRKVEEVGPAKRK